jgi:NadR type nicotinamide-nucleotide adenylyltransferase
VVLIGPECTGKTCLSEQLAARYEVPLSAEYARAYVESRGAPLGYADVEPIARGQRRGEDDAIARAEGLRARFVLLDTDLVSTLVYSRHYYGECPAWVEREAWRRRGELYLLHHVDVDWRADGLQREQPERRAELFGSFQDALDSLEVRVAAILGDREERRRRAEQAIEGLLMGRRSGRSPSRR